MILSIWIFKVLQLLLRRKTRDWRVHVKERVIPSLPQWRLRNQQTFAGFRRDQNCCNRCILFIEKKNSQCPWIQTPCGVHKFWIHGDRATSVTCILARAFLLFRGCLSNQPGAFLLDPLKTVFSKTKLSYHSRLECVRACVWS